MKKIVPILVILAGMVSCVYPYNPDLEGTAEDIVVLEGSIVAGGTSTVQFSKVSSLSTVYYSAQKIGGMAWVEDDEGKIYASQSLSPSSSINIPMNDAPLNRKYRMKAEVDNEIYYSDWLDPLAPPEIEDVSFSLTEDSTRVQVSVTLDGGEQGTGYVGLSFDETWEFHADYDCQYLLDTLTWQVSQRQNDPYPNYWCWAHASE